MKAALLKKFILAILFGLKRMKGTGMVQQQQQV
jgi:hypothetical protein